MEVIRSSGDVGLSVDVGWAGADAVDRFSVVLSNVLAAIGMEAGESR